jgi:hypothetical protein
MTKLLFVAHIYKSSIQMAMTYLFFKVGIVHVELKVL